MNEKDQSGQNPPELTGQPEQSPPRSNQVSGSAKPASNPIYPEPVKEPDAIANPTQLAALQIASHRTAEANKRVSTRVNSLYIVAILLALNSLLFGYIGVMMLKESMAGLVVCGLAAAQLAMSAYLFAGYDQRIAETILKAVVILQVLGLFSNLGRPPLAIVGGLYLVVATYAYYRVKMLPY